METLTFVLSGTVIAATPLLIAALGELAAEKSGVLNLSIEGMMSLGAVAAFIVVKNTGDYWLGVFIGGVAAMLLAALFAVIVLFLLGNQVASGLAVGILGGGMAALIGKPYESATVPPMPSFPIPILSHAPVIGRGLFDHVLLVYMAPAIAVLMWWIFKSTKVGLVLRATGESPETTHAIGYNVLVVRFLSVLFGGFMAGIAGAFISIASATLWSDGLIAGRGWIVVALVVFGAWRAERVALGAYLFGAATIGQLLVQSIGVEVPSQLLTSVPYIATIVAIALLSMDGKRIRLNAPVSLGRVYREAH